MKLKLGRGRNPFTLPVDFVTLTQAILARKRSGKSYTASVQAEELLERKQQIAVIDPTSAWWGLRSSADGAGAGYSIVVFGGDHADAPLDFRAGKAMAAALVEHGFSAIFDIGNFQTGEQVKFVMDFCSELLRINRTAMHVFMDEADTFAPQKPLGLDQNKCLGTVSRLVKQGGIRGVGFTMITQRPASINKDVLSQVDILTVLRMSHPLDIKAATDWIKSEVSLEFAKEVERELPSLPVGTAFFCSASLKLGERVEIRTRRTFNSGATPKAGERKIEPKVMAKVDIEKLGRDINASVERVKAESPEFLKKRIGELEAQIVKGGKTDMGMMEEVQAAHAELERLRAENAEIPVMQARLHLYEEGVKGLRELFERFEGHLVDAGVVRLAPTLVRPPAPAPAKAVPRTVPIAAAPRHEADANSDLSGPAQRILAALARFYAIGVYAPPRIQVCLFSGYGNLSSTGFVKAMGSLRTAGLVEYPGDGTVSLTDEGQRQAPESEPIRNNGELHQAIYQTLGGPEQRILTELIHHYPNACTRESVMMAAGYSNLSSTGFVKAMGRVRTLGYAEYPSAGNVVATPQCFLPK